MDNDIKWYEVWGVCEEHVTRRVACFMGKYLGATFKEACKEYQDSRRACACGKLFPNELRAKLYLARQEVLKNLGR